MFYIGVIQKTSSEAILNNEPLYAYDFSLEC